MSLFPDVDWYCDECDASLDEQDGFSDDCGYWTCTECGCENRISCDDVYDSKEDYLNSL